MPPKRVLVSVTIALVFLLIASTAFFVVALNWQKAFYEIHGVAKPYQAPLYGCDVAEDDLVYQSYLVLLRQGYSLENHSHAIGNGTDLNSAIDLVFPETVRHGLSYRAKLDDDALAAVRLDVLVDVVECNRRLRLLEQPRSAAPAGE